LLISLALPPLTEVPAVADEDSLSSFAAISPYTEAASGVADHVLKPRILSRVCQ
jgi:hypothetical protein